MIEAQVVEERRSPFPPWLLVAWLIWIVVFLPFAVVFAQDAARGPYQTIACSADGSGLGTSQWSWWPPGRECAAEARQGADQTLGVQTRPATWSLAIQSMALAVVFLALVVASVRMVRRRQ